LQKLSGLFFGPPCISDTKKYLNNNKGFVVEEVWLRSRGNGRF